MAQSTRAPANGFVAKSRKIYNPVGFSHGYNFVYWFIFAGALLGFCLARFMYLNFDGIYCKGSGGSGAAPGACYWFEQKYYKVNLILHLATILPAGLLVVLQFTPIIRYKARPFHRVNGYVVLTLLLVSNVTVLLIVRRAFGGALSTQAGVGVLAFGTTFAAAKAYYSIKRLEIYKHRMWMMRTWFWAASIITLRIIFIITANIITMIGSYHEIFSCDEVLYMLKGKMTDLDDQYSACRNLSLAQAKETYVAIKANFGDMTPTTGAALNISFGMALWLALTLHAVGLEVYFHYTQDETERLKIVSLDRQAERRKYAASATQGVVEAADGFDPDSTKK